MVFDCYMNLGYRPIQAKYVASATNCSLVLETAMAATVNRGGQLFTNDKYWKYFSELFHITIYMETEISISAE